MYTVRSNQDATAPTRVGEKPQANNWQAGTVQQIDTSLLPYYQEHADVFTILGGDGALTENVAVITGLTAASVTQSLVQQVTFTLANVGQTLPNTGQYIGTKLFTFPAGRINVLGCIATLQEKTTSAILGTLNAGKTGAVSLGTTVAASTTLDGTQADLLPSTAWISGATINVGGTAVSAALAVSCQLDGTTSAKELWLNSAVVTDGDLDADATISWTGSITITFLVLGDY
jgi:hypothetical protein